VDYLPISITAFHHEAHEDREGPLHG